ncbi:MAG TPA: hypothetical protein VN277_06380 [Acidiferrobacterales bacterium]|nr:hypothetical protein [Acidiferrobacterales bacterium]
MSSSRSSGQRVQLVVRRVGFFFLRAEVMVLSFNEALLRSS